MSRQSSIPAFLEPVIMRRWVHGSSPRAIAKWIEESNATRKVPVVTTPSSILRCLERTASRTSATSCLASIHRLRLQSPAAVETIAEVDAGYRAVVSRSNEPCKSDVARRLGVNLAALRHLEMSAHRQLKASGVTGAFGQKLAADSKTVMAEMARDIAAEDDLEDAGIAPEITVRHLPPELFPPAPLSPEIMAALRREQAKLFESKPLKQQPIADAIRSTSPDEPVPDQPVGPPQIKEPARTTTVRPEELARTTPMRPEELSRTTTVLPEEPARTTTMRPEELSRTTTVHSEEPARTTTVHSEEPARTTTVRPEEPAFFAGVSKDPSDPKDPSTSSTSSPPPAPSTATSSSAPTTGAWSPQPVLVREPPLWSPRRSPTGGR